MHRPIPIDCDACNKIYHEDMPYHEPFVRKCVGCERKLIVMKRCAIDHMCKVCAEKNRHAMGYGEIAPYGNVSYIMNYSEG